jgi:hypothetical protein
MNEHDQDDELGPIVPEDYEAVQADFVAGKALENMCQHAGWTEVLKPQLQQGVQRAIDDMLKETEHGVR